MAGHQVADDAASPLGFTYMPAALSVKKVLRAHRHLDVGMPRRLPSRPAPVASLLLREWRRDDRRAMAHHDNFGADNDEIRRLREREAIHDMLRIGRAHEPAKIGEVSRRFPIIILPEAYEQRIISRRAGNDMAAIIRLSS